MRRILLGVALCGVTQCGLVGCGDFEKAMEAPPRKNVVAPGGIASSGDISSVQNATGGGSTASPPTAQPGNPPAGQPAEAAKPNGSIIGKREGKIVDLAEAKKDPKIVEISSKVTGDDPLTASFNAYVSITSQASVLNFKHQMDILKAADDRSQYPSYKEAMQLMKQLKIEVASQPPWQLYGYDAKTGGLVLLENKAEKIRIYKEKGIPIEEADKPFDTP